MGFDYQWGDWLEAKGTDSYDWVRFISYRTDSGRYAFAIQLGWGEKGEGYPVYTLGRRLYYGTEEARQRNMEKWIERYTEGDEE